MRPMQNGMRSWIVLVVGLFLTGVGGFAAEGLRYRAGVKPTDTDYWMQSKRAAANGEPSRSGYYSSDDVATNVRAEQEVGSKIVSIWYDADYQSGWPLSVSLTLYDYSTYESIDAITFLPGSDVGLCVPSGRGKRIRWNAGEDWPGHLTSNMVATVNAIPAQHPSSWASITIYWASFGGRDLDVCGYWEDRPDVKVGWSWSTGSMESGYKSVWEGDNTGSGPEYIHVAVKPGQKLSGVSSMKYRVHCNYYGHSGPSECKATIVAVSGTTVLRKTIEVSDRNGSCARPSDPGVVIQFNEAGELVSID